MIWGFFGKQSTFYIFKNDLDNVAVYTVYTVCMTDGQNILVRMYACDGVCSWWVHVYNANYWVFKWKPESRLYKDFSLLISWWQITRRLQ